MKKLAYLIVFFGVLINFLSCSNEELDNDLNNPESTCTSPQTFRASDFIDNNKVNLSWTSGNGTSWEIQYGLANFQVGTGTVVIANSTNLTVSNLNPSNNYSFYIRTICTNNDFSAWVGPIAVNSVSNDCQAPTNIRATRSATNSSVVNLNWTAAGSASRWEIEYGIRGFSLGSGTIIQTNQISNQISNLQANANYDFYVRSVCSPTQITASSGPFTVNSVTSPVTYSFMNANVNGVQYNGMKPYFYPVAGVNASLELGSSRVLSFQGHSNPLSTASNNFVEITIKLPQTFWQPGTYVLEGEGAAFQNDPKPAVNLIIVQGSNTFEVFENEIPGTITILEFNSTTKRIRGTFNFRYNLSENGVTTGPFNVTNGTFDFPVDDEVFQ